LPWRDQLVWIDADGESHSVAGEIRTGDWTTPEVTFSLTEASELPEAFPSRPWRDAAGAPVRGQAFSVERVSPDEPVNGYEWKPSMPRVFGGMQTDGLARAFGYFLLGMIVVITRWWRLLSLAGCPTSWFNACRLTFLGMFFNLVVPGLTGGDLVKGVIVAKENPGRRADALVSVAVDRILGLGVLALIGVMVVLLAGDSFQELRLPLVAFIAVGALGAFLYAKKGLRKRLGLSALVDRLPFAEKLRSIDRAALLYLRHPFEMGVAVVLSAMNHLLIIVGVCEIGRAFGVTAEMVSLLDFLVLVPVANIVSALPLAPGGWGLGEATFAVLFEMVGASGAIGVAISVTFRLCQLVLGLIGGMFLLLPGGKAELREVGEQPA
jgi:uncharacterized protein (TIRG00374 family)